MCILSNFLEDSKQLNEARGRRCQYLTLPPNWNEHGIYSISVTGKEVQITHKWIKRAVEAHDEPHMPSFKKSTSLYVSDNYSETLAVLKSRDDSEIRGIQLSRLFPEHTVEPQKSITDGQTEQ